jgi:DHA3 family tetracycline resistance protein-like MFS transporter
MLVTIAYWLISIFREIRNPIYDAWMNQNVESKVRATVFSMCSQANSVGQIVGGPVLGLIATTISLRISIVLTGLVLIPTLFLYGYTIKRHKLLESATE